MLDLYSTTVRILSTVLLSISITLCCVVVIGFAAFKETRSAASKLVVVLCVVEILHAMFGITQLHYEGVDSFISCDLQTFTSNALQYSAITASCAITHCLRRSTEHGIAFVKEIIWRLVIISILVPFALAAM